MTLTCKNCGQHFKGQFCNNCGQAASTHEINFHFLWHDIQHGFFHFDKGIFYTARQLFTRPGHTIREFIGGKRVNHFKPLSMVVLLATIYGLLLHTFHINNLIAEITINGLENEKFNVELIKEWMDSHYALITLLTLPFYALGTFITFRKQGYNYMEYLVLNAFLAGQRLFLHIAVFPIIYFLNDTPNLESFNNLLSFTDFVLMVWAFSQFFNNLSKTKLIFRTILTNIIYITSLLVVGGIVVAAISFL